MFAGITDRNFIFNCNTERSRGIRCSIQYGRRSFTHDGIEYSPILNPETGEVREPQTGDLILASGICGIKVFHIKDVHPKRWVVPEDEEEYKFDFVDCVPVTQKLVDYWAFLRSQNIKGRMLGVKGEELCLQITH